MRRDSITHHLNDQSYVLQHLSTQPQGAGSATTWYSSGWGKPSPASPKLRLSRSRCFTTIRL